TFRECRRGHWETSARGHAETHRDQSHRRSSTRYRRGVQQPASGGLWHSSRRNQIGGAVAWGLRMPHGSSLASSRSSHDRALVEKTSWPQNWGRSSAYSVDPLNSSALTASARSPSPDRLPVLSPA